MRKSLTDRYIETLKPPATGRLDIVDAHPKAPGLTLRVTSTGAKSWSVRYSPKGQRQRRVSIGTYPAMRLAKARERALAIEAAAREGRDLPADEAREADERRKAAARPATVGLLVGEYVERHCMPNQRRWQLSKRAFEMHVIPKLGEKPLSELRRADIVELLDDLQNEKGLRAQVNRVRSHLIAAFNWGIEREYLDTNPAAAIKKRRIEASRSRILSHDELRAIWWAADALTDPSRALVKAWILTGQRRDEVRCMPWSELDLKAGVWTLPPERNKGKREHEVPLSPAMLELLDGLLRLGDFVFTTDGKRPYAGQKRLKEILDRESGVTGWTFHDFRRTASTGMAALNISQDVIDRVLNHAKQSLAGTYNRHAYLEEKRRALNAWADHVAFIVSEGRDAPNVVELRTGG